MKVTIIITNEDGNSITRNFNYSPNKNYTEEVEEMVEVLEN